MKPKIFNVSMAPELVKIIDEQARRHFATRSEFIKNTLLERFEREGVFNGRDIESEKVEETFRQLRRARFSRVMKPYAFKEMEDDLD